MKIVADIDIPFLKGLPEKFADEVVYFSSSQFSHNLIIDADALIVRTPDKCTPEILRDTKVRFIATASVGIDHIDTEYCDRHNIGWANAPGCNATSVAQYFFVVMMQLSLVHRFSFREKKIGLIGVGNVGSAIQKICEAYGITLFLNDPIREKKEGSLQFCPLTTLLEECDVISVHTPLTRTGEYKTFHLVEKSFFETLKRKILFINAARGEVHDTEALKWAIRSGRVEAAVIDCWEGEPHIDSELLAMTEIATPHIAGFSADGKAKGTWAAVNAVKKFFKIPQKEDDCITLPQPANILIDLNKYEPSKRIESAIFHVLNFSEISEKFKTQPNKFEYLRTHYKNPREFNAYTILNATSRDYDFLQPLGFNFL